MRSIAGSPIASLADDSSPWRRFGNIHLGPILAALVLSIVGLVTVASATVEQEQSFLTRQFLWVVVGLLAFLLALSFDYHMLVDAAPIFYGLALAALGLVLIVGHEAGGARSWFALGPFRLQPAEFAKIATALALTRYLSRLERPFLGPGQILKASLIVAAPLILIVLQRDMGSAAMFLPVLIAAVLVGGIRLRHLVAIALLGVMLALGLWNFGMKDYQRQRIRTFLAPEEDPLGAGYQVRQSKIAVGSGQLWGRGWGEGTQSQLRFLPERHSDFVMAVLAEEWGFFGAASVLTLYSVYIFSAAQIAMRSRDQAGILLAVVLVSVQCAHVIYNTGMVVGLLPITGIPLPFISYGGSFMLSNFLATGLILNVDYRRYVNR